MRRLAIALLAALAASALPTGAAAQQRALIDACAAAAQRYFEAPRARTDMRWRGVRVDGVRTVGGEIRLERRSPYVACAFARDRDRLVEFHVDGRDRLADLRRRPGAGQGGDAAPPEIRRHGDGYRATYADGCVVRYDRRGRREGAGRDCRDGQVRRADAAMRQHNRDEAQGGGGSVSPPRVEARRGGGFRAEFSDGCTVRYDDRGRRQGATSGCRDRQLRRADDAVAEHRRDRDHGHRTGEPTISGDLRGTAAVVFEDGCVVSYDERGRRVDASRCDRRQIERADREVAEWRRARSLD
jgi:hypothetical protein